MLLEVSGRSLPAELQKDSGWNQGGPGGTGRNREEPHQRMRRNMVTLWESWENHRKMVVQWNLWKIYGYTLSIKHGRLENHHVEWRLIDRIGWSNDVFEDV